MRKLMLQTAAVIALASLVGGFAVAELPTTPVPAQQTLPKVDLEKVHHLARNQATMIANKVVHLYGEMENFRYNFHQGLRDGVNIYNWVNGDLRDSRDYQTGLRTGESEGEGAGFNAGRAGGMNTGKAEGSNEAGGRFEAVVDQNAAPDLTMRVPRPTFSGYEANIAGPGTIQQRLAKKNAELEALLRGYTWSYDGYDLGYNTYHDQYWNLDTMYGWNDYQWDLVQSNIRADWAFEAWLNMKLGGRYDDAIQTYRRWSDSSQYSNASEANSTFRDEFKRTYDYEISNKWRNAVMRSNPSARMEGSRIGIEVAKEQANAVGYYDGYREAYRRQSVDGFNSVYSQAYAEGFNATVAYYQSNIVITTAQAHLVPVNSPYFVPGVDVAVIIDRVANAGRVGGNVEIGINGTGLALNSAKSIALEPSSSNKGQALNLGNMARISSVVAPNSVNQVAVRVGGINVSLQYQIAWANVVRGLARGMNLTGYVSNVLSTEFANMSGNQYNNKRPDTLLAQLVVTYNTLSPQERAAVSSHKQAFVSVYGAQPGRLHFIQRAKWNSAMDLLNQLK